MNSLILSAGIGSRFKCHSPKTLFPINSHPLLLNAIETAKQLNSDQFFIVVNPDNHQSIKTTLESYNIQAEYIIQETPNGISNAISIFSYFTEDFIIVLGDTYTQSPNLKDLLKIHKKYSPIITTTGIKDDNIEAVKRACTIEIDKDNRIKSIIEKPDFSTGIRGCGIYICKPSIFPLLNENNEFTTVINHCDSRCLILKGICENINTLADIDSIPMGRQPIDYLEQL
jgi:dTDP-glucose pyrophosphorylase